jgi:lipopolysaccharide/colanic/teichoic acid biosynthesis glycosyltransferase
LLSPKVALERRGVLKRAIDIAVSVAGLVVLSPLFALIALGVTIDSGKPVFFSQIRVGRNFRSFRIWKFRSMRADRAGPSITVTGDERITRVGRLLRTLKLDELPQLWNVLAGDMSLVGPRPELPEYVEMFRGRYRMILTVRPGITDLASVRYRNEEFVLLQAANPHAEYVGRVLPAKLDLAEDYVRKRSLSLDLAILVDTVRSLVRLVSRSFED